MEKQFWVDFVEGRIDVPAMLAETEKRPELLDWLTGIAGPEFSKGRPFDAKRQIQLYVYEGVGSRSVLGRYLNIHSMFSRILMTAFPEDGIVMDMTLDKKLDFMYDACPEYIGGPEVDHLLDALLEELPADLSKTKRVKLYKEKVKALFPMAGKKYPRWVQEAAWPISPTGKPMRFVEQKKGKDYKTTMQTHFIFEDVDSGEQRVVEQFT